MKSRADPRAAQFGAGAVRNLYVHAPFCTRRCCYCDFAVTVDRNPDSARWLNAIRSELSSLQVSGEAKLADELETLYVGGGTPSVLDPESVGALAGLVGRSRMRSQGFEWTVEANPESFTAQVARGWVASGVNRVSFGVQSFDSSALRWMGRLHSAEDAAEAVGRAKAAGVKNLSIDLIFGLPGTLGRNWKDDVERAVQLDVPHVSLYGLTVEEGTPLGRSVHEGRVSVAGEARYRDEYLFAVEALSAAGYEHYEVSNFARSGWTSRHNRACWRGDPYLGLGNGAHSYVGGRRWWNERDWAQYAGRVEEGGSGRAGSETLSPRQRRLEALWLALRTSKGVDRKTMGPGAASVLNAWRADGLAIRDGESVRLTATGWLVLDELTLELDAAVEQGTAVVHSGSASRGRRRLTGTADGRFSSTEARHGMN